MLFALSATSAHAAAEDGSFDPQWGDQGRLAIDVSDGSDVGGKLVIQTDGKLLIAGSCAGDFLCAVRLLPNGSFDPAFGPPHRPGRLLVVGTLSSRQTLADLVVMPSGRIILGGSLRGSPGQDFGVLHELDALGHVLQQEVIVGHSGYEMKAMVAQPDGKLIVLAGTNAAQVVVSRVDPATGFGFDEFGDVNGTKVIPMPGGAFGYPESVALQADGKIVVAGGVDGRILLLRLLPNGQLDDDPVTGFGDGGIAIFDWGVPSRAMAIAVDRDGSLLVAGYAYGGTGPIPSVDFFVNRLDHRGRQHPGFSICPPPFCDPGPTYLAFNRGPGSSHDSDVVQAIALQPDGRILLSGSAQTGADSYDVALARVLPTGDPDPDFGISGQAWGWFGAAAGRDDASDIVIGNGGIMIVGSSQETSSSNLRFGIAKLQSVAALGAAIFASGFE